MRPILIDTAQVRRADQYEWYSEALDRLFGIASRPVITASGAFRGRIEVLSLPPMTHMTFQVENNGGMRLKPQIRRVEWGGYCVYREMGDGVLFDLAGQTIATERGDLLVYDGDAPMQSQARASYDHSIWMIPRAILDPHLPILPRPLVVHIPAALGLAALAFAYLNALGGPVQDLTELQAGMIADNLARLIAMACGGATRPHGEAIRTAKLGQAQQYVQRNLTRPALDPDMAAVALGISVRQLHLLFEPTGETFGQYVRRRRLQECRETLESPLSIGRSVADIAYGWGFASLPTFYRVFQAAYGVAPGDLREAAARGRFARNDMIDGAG